MSIVWTDVVNLCGADLAPVPTPWSDAILAAVALQLNASFFGAQLDLASTYLAAHMGTLYLRGALGPGGPLSEEKVGPLDATYQVPLPGSPWYGTTPYGIEFMRIVRQNPVRFGFVV